MEDEEKRDSVCIGIGYTYIRDAGKARDVALFQEREKKRYVRDEGYCARTLDQTTALTAACIARER